MYYKVFKLPPLDAQNHVARQQHHLISVDKHKDLNIRSFKKRNSRISLLIYL